MTEESRKMRIIRERNKSQERQSCDTRQITVSLQVSELEPKVIVITSKFSRPKIFNPLTEQE